MQLTGERGACAAEWARAESERVHTAEMEAKLRRLATEFEGRALLVEEQVGAPVWEKQYTSLRYSGEAV